MHGRGRLLLKATAMLTFLFASTILCAESPPADSIAQLTIAEIEQEIAHTQATLDQLPRRLIRESGGTLGFRAVGNDHVPEKSWVEIDLLENRKFDSIVVVPAVLLNEYQESANHAFPELFQIRIYATAEDTTGTLLYDSTVEPLKPYPNQAPVFINCPGTSAQRIRFIPLELHEVFDLPPDIYTLSEILVFDGSHNLALGKPVTAPRSTSHRPIWFKNYLTDGYMPYSEPSMGADTKINGSRMFVSLQEQAAASITLDLGREQVLDEIRLYPIQADRNFAVFHKTAMGFPVQFKIEASLDETFRSPTLLFNTGPTDYPSPGHRLASFSANGAIGRFVRITANSLPQHPRRNGYIFAFSEIGIISQGEVVSLGADVSFSHPVDIEKFAPKMLVDGIAANGTIISLRSWLTKLAERNRLEEQLLALQSALQNRYLRQSRIVNSLKWSIGIIILIALVVHFWQRLVRQRHIYRLREDLAADLHDEIGGNFSGIALLSDDLVHEKDTPAAHIPQLTKIAEISRTSANNARALVRFLESRNVTGELLREMRTTTELLLAKHHYKFDVDGYKYVSKLEPKEKWHLLLFFKEALNNIAKHAEASEVEIQFQLTAHRLTLCIVDNGHGFSTTNNRQPAHLAMRAEKMKAKLDISSRPGGGTSITLEKQL